MVCVKSVYVRSAFSTGIFNYNNEIFACHCLLLVVGIFLELCIPFGAACQILQKQEVEFLDVVNAKPNLPQLRCKKVIAKISKSLITKMQRKYAS